MYGDDQRTTVLDQFGAESQSRPLIFFGRPNLLISSESQPHAAALYLMTLKFEKVRTLCFCLPSEWAQPGAPMRSSQNPDTAKASLIISTSAFLCIVLMSFQQESGVLLELRPAGFVLFVGSPIFRMSYGGCRFGSALVLVLNVVFVYKG